MVKSSADPYLLPLDSRSGQAAGVTRRLTHDGRYKVMAHVGGEPRMAYFYTWDFSGPKLPRNVYALDLDSLAQTLVTRIDGAPEVIVSRDGRQIASVPEGDSYSIRLDVAGADPGTARVVCKKCGLPRRFSPDGRFLLYSPEVQSRPGPTSRRLTVRLLQLASGGDRPWLVKQQSVSGLPAPQVQPFDGMRFDHSEDSTTVKMSDPTGGAHRRIRLDEVGRSGPRGQQLPKAK